MLAPIGALLLMTNTHEIDALNNASTFDLLLKIESMGTSSVEIRTLNLVGLQVHNPTGS